jgi:hypothetical protein
MLEVESFEKIRRIPVKRISTALGISLTAFMTAGCFQMQKPAPETARIRVVHASPDAPDVDICANGTTAFSDVAFPGATNYATVEEGTYQIRVVAAGSGCGGGGVINAALPLPADTETTVVAVNTLDAIEPLVLEDDNSMPTAGAVKVRFVHASPNAPTVDITLTDGTTLFDDIAFKEIGDYIEAPAGTVDLQVRDETGTVIVLTLEDATLEAGTVYTVYAVGLLNGTPALGALITVDNE